MIPRCDNLRGQYGYSYKAMNPPPAEKKPNVIQFELTTGCAHNTCTFCSMYENGYRVKTLDEFKGHVDQVIRTIRNDGSARDISRIFIGSANALSVDTDLLNAASQYALYEVKTRLTGNLQRRVALYGTTGDILNKGFFGLRELSCGGTCESGCSVGRFGTKKGVEVIYWGLESGNSDVLKLAGKKYTKEEAEKAARVLNLSQIRASTMVVPGLGGIKHFDGHVKDTADVLNSGQLEWITFIGLQADPTTPYHRMMQHEIERGTNRPLTPEELVEQTAQIIERLKIHDNTIIGVHGNNIHSFGYNPIVVGANELTSNSDAQAVARTLRENSHRLKGSLDGRVQFAIDEPLFPPKPKVDEDTNHTHNGMPISLAYLIRRFLRV